MIYTLAAERLGLRPEECVVVEDSNIGLEAARGAGMRCIITYTEATKDQASGQRQGAGRWIKILFLIPALGFINQTLLDDACSPSPGQSGSSRIWALPRPWSQSRSFRRSASFKMIG